MVLVKYFVNFSTTHTHNFFLHEVIQTLTYIHEYFESLTEPSVGQPSHAATSPRERSIQAATYTLLFVVARFLQHLHSYVVWTHVRLSVAIRSASC